MRRNLSVAVAACLFGVLLVSAWPVLAQSEWGVRGPSHTNNSTPAFTRTAATSFDIYTPGVTGTNPSFRVCDMPDCSGNVDLAVNHDASLYVPGGDYRGQYNVSLTSANAAGSVTLTPNGGTINLNAPATYDVNIAAGARMDFVGSSWHGSANTMGLRLPQNTAITCPGADDGYLAFDSDDDKLGVCAGTPTALTWRTMFSSADTVGYANGGTGQSSWTAGDLLYASAANTLGKLAAGTNGHVLTLTAGLPAWAAPAGGSGVSPLVYYGTGENGACDVSTGGTVAMAADYNCTTLSVSNNTTLNVSGWRIFATTSVTVAAGSAISAAGGDGQNGIDGGAAGTGWTLSRSARRCCGRWPCYSASMKAIRRRGRCLRRGRTASGLAGEISRKTNETFDYWA